MKIASFKAGTTATWGLVTDAGIIDAGKREPPEERSILCLTRFLHANRNPLRSKTL
jgi:hypothetical protein